MTDTDTQITLPEFVKANNLSITFERKHGIPWIEDSKGRSSVRKAGAYLKCIECETTLGAHPEKRLVFKSNYRDGKARYCCKGCGMQLCMSEPMHFTVSISCTDDRGTRGMTIDYSMGNPFGSPDVCDVIHCLKSDAQAWVYADDLEDFVRELGFHNPDSDTPVEDMKRAADAYVECARTYKRLANLLGSEAKRTELFDLVEGY